MSNLPFHTSTQLQSSPTALVANWRIKKDINAESPEFKERVGQLSIVEQDVLKYYAGDTTETRTIVLERMEAYRQQNNNQPPIAASTGANRGWICNICSGRFSTFQKAAIHVTSNEWNLFSWPCPMRLCGRTYKALDQLRRHTSKSHSNASPSSTESTTPPESAPAPQPRTIPADEFRLQPRPFTGPPDGQTQVATPFSSKYVESGIESTNQQWPQFQPQASSVFNQQPLPAALNRSFGNDISNLYHSSWHSTFGLMNTWPPSVTDVGQQFPSTGDTQHVQPCANSFPTNQYLPQRNRSHSGAVTPWYDDPTFSQLGSGNSLPSNTFEGLMKYPVPLTRSKGDSSLETEMHQQTPRAFPSSARWRGQDCIDLGEDLLSRAQSVQQSPRDISQFQPGVPPMLDELVGLPAQPSMGQFSTDGVPPLYQTSWHNTSGSMKLPPRNVTDAGQEIQPARSTHYGPATVNKPAANTQFGSDSSLASNDPGHLMDNLRSHNESQGYQEGVVHGQPSGVTPPSLEEWMTLFKFDEEFPDP